jgi:hypothetical protein
VVRIENLASLGWPAESGGYLRCVPCLPSVNLSILDENVCSELSCCPATAQFIPSSRHDEEDAALTFRLFILFSSLPALLRVSFWWPDASASLADVGQAANCKVRLGRLSSAPRRTG